MFLCSQDNFVDYLLLGTVIPGLSLGTGKAAVFAALLDAVAEGAVTLVSCFYKACSFPVQRPRWSENAASCEPSVSTEIWVAARFLMLAPAFFFFFLTVSGNRDSQSSQRAVWERRSSAHSFITAAVSPSTVHPLLLAVCSLGAVSLGVPPDACDSSGLEQASWHQQPHWPDWDPIPNLPIALTRCHFMYVCWISF